MIIYPAIDLRGGQVVRLREGDPAQQTVFSDDPMTVAQRWIDEGATWIHVVNLDGAFSDANNNSALLEQLATLDVCIQFGGGLRQLADIDNAIARGATRVVLGTIALNNPKIISQAIEKYGSDCICVALDAKDGRITTHGWTQTTDITPIELGRLMAKRGVQHALFTDVSRDGQLGGANIDATIRLARETNLRVIASGGISSLDELHTLKEDHHVAGAVIGMALYTGKMTLADAIRIGG